MPKVVYHPSICPKAVDLGVRGFCVTEAAQSMGISHSTFRRWEQSRPEFAEAAKAIRANTVNWAKERLARMRRRREASRMRALWRHQKLVVEEKLREARERYYGRAKTREAGNLTGEELLVVLSDWDKSKDDNQTNVISTQKTGSTPKSV